MTPGAMQPDVTRMRTASGPRVTARLIVDFVCDEWRAWLQWPSELEGGDEHTYLTPACDTEADARRAAHALADKLDLDVIEGAD